ncbi:MAG: AbrB/MazE/SpoVT family DNA-binding domain-containing protein [Clostridiales bacterium]|nr:AbrB/MazE/SpoVT family DNA-binding domain-containing protein [Clostridiales bacterium]
MRATGIVRRIDELGRVVIPKEIRRTLRIREGDPLEIFTDHDGEVVLKKYSPIGEIASIARDYTESLHRSLGHVALICDRDMVVSVSGNPKRELAEKALSAEMEALIQSRQTLHLNSVDKMRMVPIVKDDDVSGYTAQIVTPIVADGEVIGLLGLISREPGMKMSEADLKVAETSAGIIGRQMEQ